MGNVPARMLTRWMKLLLSAMALALLSGGAWFYGVEKAAVHRQAEREFSAIAGVKVTEIINWRQDRLDDAAQVSESPFFAEGVARYLADPDGVAGERLRDRFRSLATHGRYIDVFLVDPAGRMHISLSGRTEARADYGTALAEALRRRKPALADLHTDVRYPKPHLSAVAPIFAGGNPTAPPLGAVVLVADAAQFLYPLIQAWPTPSQTAETLLVRRDGDSVLFLNDLRHRAGAAMTLRIPLDRGEMPAVRGVTGYRGMVEGADYRGIPVLAVVRSVPDSPWVVIAKEDMTEVFAGWRGRATTFFAILATLMGGVVAIGLVAWQRDKKAHDRALGEAEATLRASVERHSVTLRSVGDEERRIHRLIATRLSLLDYSSTHGVGDVLTRALDETASALNSPVGFYDVLEPDFDTPVLSQWYPHVPPVPGEAQDPVLLARIGDLQAWARSVRTMTPVIDNGSAPPPDAESTPPVLRPAARRLMVPVVRDGRVVALLALAEKAGSYTDGDAEAAAYLADVTWHIVEAKRAEEKRRESDLRFRAIYDRADVGIAELSLDLRIRHANPAYCRRLGYTEDELVGMHLREITHPESVVANLRQQEKLVRGDIDGYLMEKRFVCKDESAFYGLLQATLVRDSAGRPAYTLGAVVDVSDRRRADEERNKLQAQLVMASKMESVGRLAGGIAHDFNNKLLVILGSAERELARSDLDASQREALLEIQKAALQSSDLTRQLVAFARSQIIVPKVLDLDPTVEGTLKMLRRLIGEDIDLVWRPRSADWRIKVDPAQLDQVLTNLCVNARDAIDGVGKVVIETERVTMDLAYCDDHPGFVPGEFVLLAVSDDGRGMDAETQKRVFEPFFTTKPVGHGTGLGLATVYGIVKQSDGFISVYSEPGGGTTFKIYLPRCTDERTENGGVPVTDSPRGQGETILLVEDEASILRLVTAMLRGLGYTVLAAGTVKDAIELCAAHRNEIQLLISDVVMADMNGRDLADRLSVIAPNLRRLFMSGYTATVIAHRGVLDPGVEFIQKPFSMDDLAIKVRSTLQKT